MYLKLWENWDVRGWDCDRLDYQLQEGRDAVIFILLLFIFYLLGSEQTVNWEVQKHEKKQGTFFWSFYLLEIHLQKTEEKSKHNIKVLAEEQPG